MKVNEQLQSQGRPRLLSQKEEMLLAEEVVNLNQVFQWTGNAF